MILSQYATSKKYKNTESSMSITSLQKQNKKIPKPKYFVPVSDGADHIDIEHSSFKKYLQHLKNKRMYQPETPNKDLDKLIKAVIKVVSEEYNEEESSRVLNLIMGELRN